MTADKPSPLSALPPALGSFSLTGLTLGIIAGWTLGFPGGLEIAVACAFSLGLYGAVLGLATWAIRCSPGWAFLGAVSGALPMLLLLVVIYLVGEANGSNDTGNPGVWIGAGILVSIPASLGAGSAALWRPARRIDHPSAEPAQRWP
jgi:hypothetical protein